MRSAAQNLVTEAVSLEDTIGIPRAGSRDPWDAGGDTELRSYATATTSSAEATPRAGVGRLDRRLGAETVIAAQGLRMSYGDLEAVRGIDLEVRRGEVFAFLGPNGAGKTTTVEVLEGYLKRTGGEVSVLGVDPEHAGADWRERVGVVLQESAAEPDLTVRECLSMYASYYGSPRPVDELIDLVGLAEKAQARGGSLSGRSAQAARCRAGAGRRSGAGVLG
jgi:ABC-type transport system involved in cytochrome bd biosynthesis fused ATPase/permease subunit